MGIVDLIKKISDRRDLSVSGASYEDESNGIARSSDEDHTFSVPPPHSSPPRTSTICQNTSQEAAGNESNSAIIKRQFISTKPVRRHSVVVTQRPGSTNDDGAGTSSNDIVTQAAPDNSPASSQARGRGIAPSRTTTFRNNKGQRGRFGITNGPDSVETTVEEDHPALVAPRCKPNDIILVYRDLSDLASTGLRSIVSGFNIMFNDNASLRRRALHEESQTGINGSSSCKIDTEQSLTRMQERSERSNLVLWWRPLYTIWYFILECNCLLFSYTKQLWHNKGKVLVALLLVGILAAIYNIDGSHQTHVAQIEKKLLWCGYWVVLGIMSSVGLGTGLHTFVLYLGPFIAKVTLAAYECQSLEFPEPPYPSSIGCPGEDVTKDPAAITLWSIMGKVRLEAMMWGAGTAIGELPPYFMARAAKLSGTEDDLDDDELGEILDIEEKKRDHPESLKNMGFAEKLKVYMHSLVHKVGFFGILAAASSFMERIKVYMHSLVHKVGFFGILACASIPNPLFDLAGITCGHFLVPFWTFFGATLIGKAVIKMHIQQLIVIFAFSEHHVELLLNLIKSIPTIGDKIAQPFKDYLVSQRAKLHGDSNQSSSETPWLAWIFEKLIIIMVAYFVISIINSFAQNYHKRLCQGKRKPLTKSGGKLN